MEHAFAALTHGLAYKPEGDVVVEGLEERLERAAAILQGVDSDLDALVLESTGEAISPSVVHDLDLREFVNTCPTVLTSCS